MELKPQEKRIINYSYDVIKLIEKFKYINLIITIYLDKYIKFEQSDLDDFKEVINLILFEFQNKSIKILISRNIYLDKDDIM